MNYLSLQLKPRRRVQALCAGWLILHLPFDSSAAQPKAPAQPLQTLRALQERMSNHVSQARFSSAAWGVKVISLTSGKTLFDFNGSKLMKPASNAKLYTGALALDRLGPAYRIKTSLYARARPDAAGTLHSDLIIYGRGDPGFAARFYDGDYRKSIQPLLDAVVAAGIKRVEGDLIGDESHFRGAPLGAGWTWEDLQYYYGAEVSALSIEDNTVDLRIEPGPSPGAACQIQTLPTTSFLTFVNRTQTLARQGQPPAAPADSGIELYRPVGENLVYVSGHIPLGASPHTNAVAVHHPAMFFVSLFKSALASRGVEVSGKAWTRNWHEHEIDPLDLSKWVEVGDVESRPLAEVLSKMMKPSQNLYAQLLLLQVGADREAKASSELSAGLHARSGKINAGTNSLGPRPRQTTVELGLAELRRFLEQAGINPREVLLEEGSGLSRSCLVTPNATVELLRFMSRHHDSEIFRDSLPVAGVDGTLRSRMRGTKAAGQVKAKTGSLRFVTALSGYLTTAAQEPLVFSILLNNYPGPQADARSAVDDLAVLLANFAGRTRSGQN